MQDLFQSWLTRQCESGGRSSRGTLWARKTEDGPVELFAIHPPNLGMSAPHPVGHRGAAAAALAAQRDVVKNEGEIGLLAAPALAGELHVCAVIEWSSTKPREQANALEAIRLGIEWLTWGATRPQPNPKTEGAKRDRGAETAARTLDLLAAALEPRPVASTSLALATELASQLNCERVSLGLADRGELVLEAISHTAQLDRRSGMANDLVAVMQEAIDQDTVIVHPSPEGQTPLAVSAHRRLLEEQTLTAVWTLPLRDDDELMGALVIEFAPGQRPPKASRAWLEQIASLLGPVLGMRRRDQASFGERMRTLMREDLPQAVGLDRLNVRLALGVGAIIVLALALMPATHRVAAPAELEGTVQRAIVAPMEAFVAESRHRAGDVVKKGTVLGVLEDSDLRIEARKWEAKRDQRRKELRAAMADRDRAQVRILQAQAEQAEAELELINEQRRRTRLIAPFDGVVTHGDLSQSLGSPVERGETLFEVAPQDDYRIILEVDGRDIGYVEAGQTGSLTLQAQPGSARPFQIRRVTPISSAEEGRSFFRVEALLEGDGSGLRPGMDGVAKIAVGQRSLLWIWTHSALEWLRMAWWAWVP